MAETPGVLVTRPTGAAANGLCAVLRNAGYQPVHMPLIELEPLAELAPASRALLMNLDRYQHIIFVSANAASFGMDRVEDFWPQLPVGIHWYAIGEATARLLQEYGVTAITPTTAMTSEGLLAVPSLSQVNGDRVLIIKGEGGRDRLRRTLAERGAHVDELACYRRHAPQLKPGEAAGVIERHKIATLLISSGEGLANLLQLLSPGETSNVVKKRIIVPSERVAEAAREAGFVQVVIAHNATDRAMLRALGNCLPAPEKKL